MKSQTFKGFSPCGKSSAAHAISFQLASPKLDPSPQSWAGAA